MSLNQPCVPSSTLGPALPAVGNGDGSGDGSDAGTLAGSKPLITSAGLEAFFPTLGGASFSAAVSIGELAGLSAVTATTAAGAAAELALLLLAAATGAPALPDLGSRPASAYITSASSRPGSLVRHDLQLLRNVSCECDEL